MTTALSAPLRSLRATLAPLASVIAYLGVADATAAALAIHIITVPADTAGNILLIDFADYASERYRVGAGKTFEQRKGSSLFLYFRREIDPTASNDAVTLAYLDAVGAILDELETVAGAQSPDRLAVTEIEMEQAPERIAVEKRGIAGDYYESAFRLTYTRQPVPA